MRWLMLTLFVVWSTLIQSVEAIDSKATPHTYLVGVEDVDYFPFFTKEDNASPPGLMIEILNHFAAKEGLSFEYVYLPIARFPDWYDSADIDFRIPDNPNWPIETAQLTYSDSIVKLHTEFVTLKASQQESISQFRTIGTIKGFTPSPQWLEKIDNNEASFIYDSSVKVLLILLKRSLIDAIDINIAVARHYGLPLGLNSEELVVFK